MEKTGTTKFKYLLVMAVFGCLGPIVRGIGMPSPVVTCLRAWISAGALALFMLVTRHKVDRDELRRVFWPMVLSGVMIAVDWIGLFTAYNYTTIATATVCYYFAPMLVLLAAAVLLKEKFTARHLVCAVVAFVGVALISGVADQGFSAADFRGPLFAVLGAVGYAAIIILNKRFPSEDALLRTTVQLGVAAVLMTPYMLLTQDMSALQFTPKAVLLLLLLGVGLTAVTYILYFRYVAHIPARTVAIFAYADPLVAVLVSVFFVGEPLTLAGALGAVLVIGAAVVSEL